ncbi:pantetheine-phosphate adenylyltransferase [Candidatus Woesebacteria bacterium]|jgi:pantetheine-phosphate adenylyltransferase|nr:pantetheine-phosphate adenylyltransferase [Candidatus Woesebacteria bacterium]HNV45082.1 pantetheine-phosphate adenylyltransferase [Candidatus Woesebacteria bacterium]HOC07350.1 pantetheine-phosphate adenylyltransferase [Candidatus Woesebacteria bacterium]HOI05198.1 pantetheine-phosphate adenylyltransferase [Candidatus Woesebacteria bacterium]HOP39162.1 pantetheine-phosphate adenylyltransferase [Candidatus Woesebacteria bacterium]
MTRALYALSGDPITHGHLDIITRAAKAFDQLIVAIGVNRLKNYLFTLEEREEMARRSLVNLKNVKVMSFTGLLVDFAYENNVDVIVKGVRTNQDFEYEQNLHLMGESQRLGIDTFLLFTKPELSHISSSAVKEIQKDQGLIQDYVSPYVKQCLEKKLSKQYIVGLTGEIGSGKSYVGEQLVQLAKKDKISAHNIELDLLAQQIQEDLSEEKYELVRQEIIKNFGQEVAKKDGRIDRKALGEIVFADSEKLNKLNKIMRTPILVRLRKELKNKEGLIILNAALLAETQMMDLSNFNLILLDVNEQTQAQRLIKRGLSQEQIKRRLASQYDFAKKKKIIEQAISDHQYGRLFILDNSVDDNKQGIADLWQELKEYFSL